MQQEDPVPDVAVPDVGSTCDFFVNQSQLFSSGGTKMVWDTIQENSKT